MDEKVFEKNFALRLSMLREKKNVTAREMSLAIGQNPGYINHIENNQTTPSLSGLLYICEYLGITPAQFFDTENENPEKFNRINEYLKKLTDEELDAVENILRLMSKR